ncbi:MAG: nuclear transport factor 2 family protein [Acidobacteriota bacterium]
MSRLATFNAVLALCLLSVPAAIAETDNGKALQAPPELAALKFLIGEWDLTTSFAQADGTRRESKARLAARYTLGGRGILVEETHADEEGPGEPFVSAVLYSVHPEDGRIVGASNNTLGNRKLYAVTSENDRILISQTGELFGGRKGSNRHVLFNISPERYELRLDACAEDGVTCVEGTYSYIAERRQVAQPEPTAAPGNPLEIAQSYLELYAAQDLAGCAEKLAEEAVFQDSVMVLRGRDAIITGLSEVFESLTIDSFEAHRWIESGPRLIAADGVVRFRQDGAFAGRPGTTLRFEIPVVVMVEIEAERVIRHVDLVDVPAYREQLEAQLASSP